MGKTTKPGKTADKRRRHETPLVVYLWSFGLGLVGYLMARMVLSSLPHPWHWIVGLMSGILGYLIGWLWYRWRGDVI